MCKNSFLSWRNRLFLVAIWNSMIKKILMEFSNELNKTFTHHQHYCDQARMWDIMLHNVVNIIWLRLAFAYSSVQWCERLYTYIWWKLFIYRITSNRFTHKNHIHISQQNGKLCFMWWPSPIYYIEMYIYILIWIYKTISTHLVCGSFWR